MNTTQQTKVRETWFLAKITQKSFYLLQKSSLKIFLVLGFFLLVLLLCAVFHCVFTLRKINIKDILELVLFTFFSSLFLVRCWCCGIFFSYLFNNSFNELFLFLKDLICFTDLKELHHHPCGWRFVHSLIPVLIYLRNQFQFLVHLNSWLLKFLTFAPLCRLTCLKMQIIFMVEKGFLKTRKDI